MAFLLFIKTSAPPAVLGAFPFSICNMDKLGRSSLVPNICVPTEKNVLLVTSQNLTSLPSYPETPSNSTNNNSVTFHNDSTITCSSLMDATMTSDVMCIIHLISI